MSHRNQEEFTKNIFTRSDIDVCNKYLELQQSIYVYIRSEMESMCNFYSSSRNDITLLDTSAAVSAVHLTASQMFVVLLRNTQTEDCERQCFIT